MIEIDLEEEKKALAREYKELLRISYQTLTPEDKKLIRKAFDVAVDAHKEWMTMMIRHEPEIVSPWAGKEVSVEDKHQPTDSR